MTTFSRHLITRLFNAPVALLPEASTIAMDLLARASGDIRADGGAASEIGAGEESGSRTAKADLDRPYDMVAGVAVIPVRGVLLQRIPRWLWYYADDCGVAAYDRIRFQFMTALADDAVDAIVFDVDSPGGEVAGCFDLADTIYRARGIKPLAAILGENAFSAAYALVSSVDPGRIWVPRTGGTGSVGVIYMHLAIAKWLANNGFTPTLVTFGAFKGEGSEMIELSEEARARLQADVDIVGDLFNATVARNREMAKKDVAATEAGTFLGAKGVDIRFADAVAAPDEAFRALLKQLD